MITNKRTNEMSEKIENVLICEDCAFYLVNGELPPDAMEEEEEHIKYHAHRLISHYKYGSVGENKGFSISSCDCCGTKLHGDRYEWGNAGLN